jgi:2-oxoglutarate dehydrogenase E2 component (dihydrolipoamide succinyltransferase)
MVVELKVPEVGESITEVQIGVLKEAGAPAVVGEVIGYMEAVDGEESADAAPAVEEAPAPTPTPVQEEEPEAAPVPTPTPEPEPDPEQRLGAVRMVMPAARRLMAEHGLAPEDVLGTGPGGRVLKEDVLRHLSGSAVPPEPSAKAETGGGEEEAVPMSPLRKRVAERLVNAQQTMALLTTFNEIDMSAVMALRREYKDRFLEKHGVKLGFMSFFAKAVVEALKAVPALNAEIRDDEIVYKNHYDIGVAVGGGKGLVVPVIRGVDRLSFAEVEKKIGEYAEKARTNKIDLEDLTGGTFTISNGGVYGSLLSTPIVNPPQSGILGLHAINERPVGIDGEIVLRPMMYVAVTYDHRIVDGREAVTFLIRIKDVIENPTRMLLEV